MEPEIHGEQPGHYRETLAQGLDVRSLSPIEISRRTGAKQTVPYQIPSVVGLPFSCGSPGEGRPSRRYSDSSRSKLHLPDTT